MGIVIKNPRFHGKLLAMIGKTVDEALVEAPGAEIVNESGRAQRLVWRERARIYDEGREFPIYLMARAADGKIWAVGIWSPEFAYLAEKGEGGNWFFNAVGKQVKTHYSHVNWIVREKRKFVNIGLGE